MYHGDPLTRQADGSYAPRVTDFHTHAFPDPMASRALSRVSEPARIKPVLDGRLSSLLSSMDEAGIRRSVILSIATRPDHFDSILGWSRTIASERIVPFLSVHPADPLACERIRLTAAEGFRGLKFHPYYQDFDLDTEAMFPLYEEMEKHGLVCVQHAGFDFAFPRVRKADPARILRVANRFPSLELVAAHLGGWEDWDEVREKLVGTRIWLDLSFTLEFLRVEEARALVRLLGADRVLFGSDSPWAVQAEPLRLLRRLALGAEVERAILSENARRLLGF